MELKYHRVITHYFTTDD